MGSSPTSGTTLNIFDMKTESTETQEKKLETLEEAAMAVLCEGNAPSAYYYMINIASKKIINGSAQILAVLDSFKPGYDKMDENKIVEFLQSAHSQISDGVDELFKLRDMIWKDH